MWRFAIDAPHFTDATLLLGRRPGVNHAEKEGGTAMAQGSDGLALLGRALLATLFILSGWEKLTGFSGLVDFIAGRNLPIPQALAVLTVAIELGGGVLLLLGLKARWVAWVFVVFVLVITPIFHDFWNAPAGQMKNQEINFLKNLSILGGMFMVAAFGPGRFSVDRA
jgi:putative oxidoreductase